MKKDNFILGLHPYTSFVAIISIVVTALLMRETRYFYIGFLLFLVISLLADRLASFLKSFMIFVFPVGILLGLLISLFMPGKVLFEFLFLSISREGIIRANIFISRLFLIFGAIILFFNTVNIKELILSLEDKGVGREQTFAILSMVQVFDEFNRNIAKFIAVSKTRGVRIEGNIFERGKSLFPMVVPIYQLSRESIENNVLLMETRGFSLEQKKKGQIQVPYRKVDRLLNKIFYLIPIAIYIWRISR